MKTMFTAAALCLAATIGTASAHPTGDGHHLRYGPYAHAQPGAYGYGHRYGHHPRRYHRRHYRPHHAQPSYSQPHYAPPQYTQPQHSQPQYTQPQYIQPQYTQPPVQYSQPQPQYRAPAPQQRGYGAPIAYGQGPGYVPGRFPNPSSVPASEGLNVGYSGGPTIGRDRRRLVNGVEIFGPPS